MRRTPSCIGTVCPVLTVRRSWVSSGRDGHVPDARVGHPVRRSTSIPSSGGWPRRPMSTTCAGSPGACPRGSSTTSTGRPDERTYGANTEPSPAARSARVLHDVSNVDPSTTLARQADPAPPRARPHGLRPYRRPRGRAGGGRADGEGRDPLTLSTIGTHSIEEIAAVTRAPSPFQLYVFRDRGLTRSWSSARRRRATRRSPSRSTPRCSAAGAGHPPGLHPAAEDRAGDDRRRRPAPRVDVGVRQGEPIVFANVAGKDVATAPTPSRWPTTSTAKFDPSLSWADVSGCARSGTARWSSRGSTVADAEIAADLGLEAVALSNHGGRSWTPPRHPGPGRARRAGGGDRLEVVCDGGAGQGSDVVKAVALGAKAVMAGRVHFYASAPAASGASTTCSAYSTPACAARWPWSAPPRSTRSPATSWVIPDAATQMAWIEDRPGLRHPPARLAAGPGRGRLVRACFREAGLQDVRQDRSRSPTGSPSTPR